MSSIPLTIKMHEADNVAIVANDGGLPAGALLDQGIVLRDRVPQGHKVALVALPEGTIVRRYNAPIGIAVKDIAAGSWVHGPLLRVPAAQGLENLPMATRADAYMEPLEGYTFEGFRNPDGSVGTRNILAITQSVQCVAGVTKFAVERVVRELLPRYPNVDGVVSLEHAFGCGVAVDVPDAEIPIRTLRNISLNPNFGGEVMVVSLGCEKLQPARLMLSEAIPAAQREQEGLDVVCLQSEAHIGFMSMVESIMRQAEVHLQRLDQRRRETVPASELVVGVQCGGSDAFSGVTANPAVGFCSDLLVRAGATVMFSEATEVRDGVAQLTARAATPEVAQAIVHEVAWYDAYLHRGKVDRSDNTSPGNMVGGLSNIAEKAMGSIIKSGTAPIAGVLSPGEKVSHRGLYYAATPAVDYICGTLQLAAGMNVHVFTTGRGSPYGLAEVPVVKVATRTDLARRWHDLMDVNAGTIVEGKATIEDVGWEVFQLILDVASGRKQTWAERWKLHNQLVLFNPTPTL